MEVLDFVTILLQFESVVELATSKDELKLEFNVACDDKSKKNVKIVSIKKRQQGELFFMSFGLMWNKKNGFS